MHESEAITYTQQDDILRARVRALIVKHEVANNLDPNPERDLDRVLWEIAVDQTVLTFLDPPKLVDRNAVTAKINTASDAALVDIITRVMTRP